MAQQKFNQRPGGQFLKQRGNLDGKESSEGQQEVEAGEEGSAAGAEFEEVLKRVNGARAGNLGNTEGLAVLAVSPFSFYWVAPFTRPGC